MSRFSQPMRLRTAMLVVAGVVVLCPAGAHAAVHYTGVNLFGAEFGVSNGNVNLPGTYGTHYTYPTWWQSDFYRPDRADRAAMNVAGADDFSSRTMPQGKSPDVSRGRAGQREEVVASAGAGDSSPHFDGRAQPGDVLGVETGGERTYVGDTTEDENKRRRDAQQAAAKQKS